MAEDEPNVVKFHMSLSDRTVYMRFLSPLLLSDRVAHERLARICHCDYDRENTLIAVVDDEQTGEEIVIGACRMTKLHGVNVARFSLLVSDKYQGFGVGTQLLMNQIEVAKAEKITQLETITVADLPAGVNSWPDLVLPSL